MIVMTILLLGLLGFLIYWFVFREKPIEYRSDIPENIRKIFEESFPKDKYPNMKREDIIKIANYRYKTNNLNKDEQKWLEKCNENITKDSIRNDCRLDDINWSCGEKARTITRCPGDASLLTKTDKEITELLDKCGQITTDTPDKIMCSSVYPNKDKSNQWQEYNDSPVTKNTRMNIAKQWSEAAWNTTKKDFTKL